MDIAAWLRDLGLEQYEQAFLDNAIDTDVLPTLTADDLKDIGVTVVGHRRKLLNAIATLREPEPPADGEPISEPPPVADRRGEAERRQLTVMFVDLVGSTELSARIDPEDMGTVIHDYQASVAEVVKRWGGHVAKYMGDGVLAYFGYPQAHEDDAERAVRAGLDLVGAVGRLVSGDHGPLAARVGIATGLVMVGDLVGEGAAQEQAVVGETLNLAARLQALAEPGRVVIGRGTRRLLGGLFELADLGLQQLKGFAEPVRAYRVLGESRAESRFEALHGARLLPLVGREHELGLLLDRWARVKDGEGQVVLLSGEPGIGKSRIVRALRERLADETYTPLSYFCSPYYQNSAFHPVIGLLERAAGFSRDDSPAEQLVKLEALVSPLAKNLDDAVPLIAALLSIPTGDRYPPLDLTPQRQKQRTVEVLLEQLEGLAARQPVLALYEDMQWIDPSTLELLGMVVDRVQRLPVLVMMIFRPEFSPPWTGYAHVTGLALNRLGRREGAAMIERLAGGKPLPREMMEQILARTDGVPLFVEELTKTVLESGLLHDAGDHFELKGPLPPLAIPATLHDSLMARLDRLAPVKEIAQVGAVIGREFSHALLATVAERPEGQLQAALDQLVQSELIFRRGAPPEATYSFKHGLVRDAAYESLLKSRRQQLHARLAQLLEQRYPDIAETEPELLAHHYSAAGLVEQAVEYWWKAGQLAIRRSAAAEAVAQLRQALDLLRMLPDCRARPPRELNLQVALGAALTAAKGYAAPETVQAYARARELCTDAGDPPQLFRVLFGQAVVHMLRAEHEAALDVAEELLRLAQRQDDSGVLLIGHRVVGASLYHLGRLDGARTHLERALALYEPAQHHLLSFLYTEDPRVAGLSWLSWTLFVLGYPDQSLARSREARSEAAALSHRTTLAYALAWACVRAQLCRDGHTAQERAEELIALATEQGFPLWLAAATMIRGWALADVGHAEVGLVQLQEGLDAWRATGAEGWVPYYLALLAEAYGRAGEPALGLSHLAEALARVRASGARWIEAELHRLRGELLLALPSRDAADAETCFRQAIEVACTQNAESWQLRAATSLARLWREQSRRSEAQELLAPVYAWFTEGFDTADLKDAKALLDELQ